MTTRSQPAARGSRQRRERRFIPPFGDGSSPNALSNLLERTLSECKFAPFDDVALLDEDAYTLAPEESNRPIEPRFALSLDSAVFGELTRTLGCSADDLTVGLSIRSRHLRRYEKLEAWKSSDIPAGVWRIPPDRMELFQTGRDIDFVLSLLVLRHSADIARQGLEYGKVLTRKQFAIKEMVDASTFPFEWVEFGGESGYPDNLLWAIRWNIDPGDEDRYSCTVAEALTVLGNKKAEQSLKAMGDASGGLAWRMMAADITTQIWCDTLLGVEEPPDESDTETLAGQVYARLARASRRPYAEIRELASQDDSLFELRSLISQIIGVVR